MADVSKNTHRIQVSRSTCQLQIDTSVEKEYPTKFDFYLEKPLHANSLWPLFVYDSRGSQAIKRLIRRNIPRPRSKTTEARQSCKMQLRTDCTALVKTYMGGAYVHRSPTLWRPQNWPPVCVFELGESSEKHMLLKTTATFFHPDERRWYTRSQR